MNCPECGSSTTLGMKYCKQCGHKLATAIDQPQTDQTFIAGQPHGMPPTQAIGQPHGMPPTQAIGQQSYNQAAQYGYNQAYGAQQPLYGQPGLAVPPSSISAEAGKVPALLMLSASAIIIFGLFLPFIEDSVESFSFASLIMLFITGEANSQDLPAASFIILAYPLLALLPLLFAILAYRNRKQYPAVINLILGLLISGFFALLWIGFAQPQVQQELGFNGGLALPVTTIGSLALLVTSFIYLVTKKQAR